MQVDCEKCCELLLGMDDIVIVAHQNPDGDTLGSSFALMYTLEQLGKRARVECTDPFPMQYGYMFPERAQSYFEPKYIVTVDLADKQLFGKKTEKYCDRVELCIDHHESNSLYAKNTFLKADAAATAELIENIIYELPGTELTKKIADCIYTGVATDTGCFRYSNTTAHSHAVAGRMFRAGCDYTHINYVMFEQKSFSRIAIEREVMNTIEYHFNNKCALCYITREMMDSTGALDSELEGVAAIPREIEGVMVGVTLREKEGGFKVSLRTDETTDATAIAGLLGGGGHTRASGCFISAGLMEAKEIIISAVGKVLSSGEDNE